MSDCNFEPTWPTRRKEGCKCSWCGESLNVGVTYASFGQVYDGNIKRLNMHGGCFLLGWSKHSDEFALGEMTRGKPFHREDFG